MTELEAEPEPVYRLVHSVDCLKCGYDLRGARVDQVCPECGSRVSDSLMNLVVLDAATLRRYHHGLTMVMVAIVLSILTLGFAFIFAIAFPVAGRNKMIELISAIAAIVVIGVGPWVSARGWTLVGAPSPMVMLPGGGEVRGVGEAPILGVRQGSVVQSLSLGLAIIATAVCVYTVVTGPGSTRDDYWLWLAIPAHGLWAARSYVGLGLLAAILRRGGEGRRARAAGALRAIMGLLVINALMALLMLAWRNTSARVVRPSRSLLELQITAGGIVGALGCLLMLVYVDFARRAARGARAQRGPLGDATLWQAEVS